MTRFVRRSVALLVLLTACGVLFVTGSGVANANAPVKPKARKIKVDSRSYAFSPKKITVKAGQNITIVLHSTDQRHDFTIAGKGTVVAVSGGKTASGGFRLTKPGKYTFYCSIPGHRAAGMQGTITAT